MTLVKTRAAFEKAVTDAVSDVDPTITMVYDNVPFVAPGKTKKYIILKDLYLLGTELNMLLMLWKEVKFKTLFKEE